MSQLHHSLDEEWHLFPRIRWNTQRGCIKRVTGKDCLQRCGQEEARKPARVGEGALGQVTAEGPGTQRDLRPWEGTTHSELWPWVDGCSQCQTSSHLSREGKGRPLLPLPPPPPDFLLGLPIGQTQVKARGKGSLDDTTHRITSKTESRVENGED